MTDSETLPVGSDPPDLRLRCRRVGNDIVVVAVAGELDMATAPKLRDYLVDNTAGRPAHLVLDLSAVTSLASHGIAVLLDAGEESEGIHGELHLIGVTRNRPVRRVLEITSTLALFDIHDDEVDLLRRLAH